jgi:hypothetical protein
MVPQAVLEHPTFMPRLTWKSRERIPIADALVPESIAGASADTAFFCDSSAITDKLDPAMFEALLAVPDRLVLTPFVIAESKEWLGRHLEHPLAAAMLKKEAQVQTRKPPPDGAAGRKAYDYYLWMLLMRRRAFEVADERFRSEHGRDPDDSEREALRGEVQRDLGPRGFLLGNKGFSRMPTDEALVYLAVEYALTTGRPTIVLSGDADVEEQFFKLLWLIDTHYRGMLLADRYTADWAAFNPRQFPDRFLSHPSCPFEAQGSVLIERGDGGLMHVLPPRPRCVAISCWRVGTYFSSLTFMAEQEMKRVIEIKDHTGGLTTDRLGERNIHPWLGLLPLQPPDAFCAGVVRDKRIPLADTGVSIALYDITLAVTNRESHRTLVGGRRGPTTINSPTGTPVVYPDLVVPTQSRQRGRRGR